jgi:hypothetical protein
MFNPISITISKENYVEYITRYADKRIDKFFEKMDDDNYVEGYLFKLPNSRDCFYDELWLFDTNDEGGFAPVVIQNINTSSCHSMWCCNFDDYCEEDDWDLENLLRMVGNGWKKGLKKVIEEEYINKKKEDSIDDILNSFKQYMKTT